MAPHLLHDGLFLFLTAALFGWLGKRYGHSLRQQNPIRGGSQSMHFGLYVGLCSLLPMLLCWAAGGWAVHYWLQTRLNQLAISAGQDLPATLWQQQVQMLATGHGLQGQHSPILYQSAANFAFHDTTAHWVLLLLILSSGIAAGLLALRRVHVRFPARERNERMARFALMLCSMVAVAVTISIFLSVIVEAWRFFGKISWLEFFFGTEWSPQTALRADQAGASGTFGAVPLFTGTLLIMLVAMCVAVPTGLMTAIFLSEYASRRLRHYVKPVLEMLAGVPTVVYGYFAAVTLAPALKSVGMAIGLSVSPESALAAGLVMGVMILPFITSLSDDVMHAVPQSLRDASFGLGATRSETIVKVVLPAALPGIMGAILLAISRAVGETMIVVMAAGLAANMTLDPLQSVTTVTAQIKSLLVGDQEFDSAKTLAAFALGLTLFFATLALNVLALWIVRRFREQYE